MDRLGSPQISNSHEKPQIVSSRIGENRPRHNLLQRLVTEVLRAERSPPVLHRMVLDCDGLAKNVENPIPPRFGEARKYAPEPQRSEQFAYFTDVDRKLRITAVGG